MQTAFSVPELAERWGLSPSTVRRMEYEGKLHRLPYMPGPRYSAAEVYQIESLGPEAERLSAWERKRMQEEIKELKARVADLQTRLAKVMLLAQGAGEAELKVG